MTGYQVMPRLTPDEYAELEQSIRENGVQVPITVGPDGRIIDGHHRDEIARKYDLHCPRVTAQGDEQKLRSLAFSLNLHRRHLTREQKRQIIAESLKADPQLSNREHAKRTGASTTTVGTVRDDMEDDGRLSKLDSRVSGDGRVRPATQPSRPSPAPEFAPDEEIVPGMTAGQLDELNVQPRTGPTPADPPKPKRRPLEEQFFDATHKLTSVCTTLQNLGNDDRLPRNREQVARYRSDLMRAIDTLHRVADQLS